jgi:hypothetical protein
LGSDGEHAFVICTTWAAETRSSMPAKARRLH